MDKIAPRLSFFFGIGMNFYMEVRQGEEEGGREGARAVELKAVHGLTVYVVWCWSGGQAACCP